MGKGLIIFILYIMLHIYLNKFSEYCITKMSCVYASEECTFGTFVFNFELC